MPGVLGNSEIYAYYTPRRPPYLFTISKSKTGPEPRYGYDLIVKVTSEFDSRNQGVAGEFERKTGIDLREAPEFLKRLASGETGVFNLLNENSSRAMDILRSMRPE